MIKYRQNIKRPAKNIYISQYHWRSWIYFGFSARVWRSEAPEQRESQGLLSFFHSATLGKDMYMSNFFLNETWEHIKLRCPFKRGTTKGRGRFFHEISKEVRRNEIKSLHFDTSTAAALNYSSILFSSITLRERLQTKRICVWYQLFRPRQKVGQLFHDVPFATIYKSDCRTFQTDVILNNKRTYRTAVFMYKRF